MTQPKQIEKYLPLTESTYYIMLALAELPLHGYGVMQKVEMLTNGAVSLGPGTLYGVFSTLEKEKLIQKVSEVERRKSYALTPKGQAVLSAQITRLETMTRLGQGVRSYLAPG
jgi:DNA-binding PadR family transcriptional regulator